MTKSCAWESTAHGVTGDRCKWLDTMSVCLAGERRNDRDSEGQEPIIGRID